MSVQKIDIDVFVADQEILLAEFRRYWVDEHVKDPESFPYEMPEGEWHEQFNSWLLAEENEVRP